MVVERARYLLAVLGLLGFTGPVHAQREEYRAGREECLARTGDRLEELAAWCHGERLYLERDRCYEALLALEPEHAEARRFLHYRRTKSGWVQQGYRAPRNHSGGESREAELRRSELEAAFRSELDLLARRTGVERERMIADVLLVFPEDGEARAERGEVKDGGRWMLAETAAARTKRAALEASLRQLSRSGVEILTDPPGEDAAREELPWKNSLRSAHLRLRSCGERAESEAHLRLGESAIALFREAFGAVPELPHGLTVYVLDCPRTREEFLARCNDGGLALLEQGCASAWSADRDALAVSAGELDARLDHTARQTVQRLLADAFGLGPGTAWAYEGFGLALAHTGGIEMRPFMSKKRAPLAATAALLGLTSAAWIGGFQNGSFEDDFEGWKAEASHVEQGTAYGAAWCTVDDSWRHAGADGTVATLNVEASAGVPLWRSARGSKAFALARLRQEITSIPSTHLSFDWGTGFIGDLITKGTVSYGAKLIVERLGPAVSPEPLLFELELIRATEVSPDLRCGTWIAWEGYRRYHPPSTSTSVPPGSGPVTRCA